MESQSHDVAIIGGGAAGLSAALVLGRARRRVVVIDAGTPCNGAARHMQGFLSRDGLPPSELLLIARGEVERYGVEFIEDRVVDATAGFVLRLAGGGTIHGRQVLIATGATDELPDIPGARERRGRDLLHCPYCHGWEVRHQPLGVLATGPGSVEYAHLLRQWSDDVILFTDRHPIAEEQRATLHARGIAVIDGHVERLVIADDRLGAVRLDVDGRIEHLVVADDRLHAVPLADGRTFARAAVFIRPRRAATPTDSEQPSAARRGVTACRAPTRTAARACRASGRPATPPIPTSRRSPPQAKERRSPSPSTQNSSARTT